MLRKQVIEIIKKARDQGFLTQEEILEIFPDAENRIDELDNLYDQLLSEGIDVFESVASDDETLIETSKEKLDKEI